MARARTAPRARRRASSSRGRRGRARRGTTAAGGPGSSESTNGASKKASSPYATATTVKPTRTPTSIHSCSRRRTNSTRPSASTPYSSSLAAATTRVGAVGGRREEEPGGERGRRERERAGRPGQAAAAEQPVDAEPGEQRERRIGEHERRPRCRPTSTVKLGWSIDRTRLRTVAVASTISGRSTADRHCGFARGLPCRALYYAGDRGPRAATDRPILLLMRIAVLPGIWPPDVGGPATHGPELARFLVGRGHSVQVVTMASAPPTERPCPVTTVDRGRPFPVRYGELTVRAAARPRARRTSSTRRRPTRPPRRRASRRAGRSWPSSSPTPRTSARAAGGSSTERSRSSSRRAARRLAALKRARTRALAPGRGADRPEPLPRRDRARLGPRSRRGSTSCRIPAPAVREPAATERRGLVFAGRLTRQKAIHVALDALAYVPAAALHDHRRRPRPRPSRAARARRRPERPGSLRRLAAARARCSTRSPAPRPPSSRATGRTSRTPRSRHWRSGPAGRDAVGGVAEVVSDGVNGLLVPPGSPEAFGQALRRLLESPELRTRLSDGARDSVLELGADRIYGRIEELLEAAVRP